MPSWLNNAVFYEIYPQSFQDSNADGIGDLNGIISRLDYVRSLGCNAIWLNPLYVSPFKDAGYDVADYKKVAPRYGSNGDLYRLFGEAHRRGMHVLLDLVPGHTSEKHPWFLESCRPERNAYTDRYIWTDSAFQGIANHLYIAGDTDRDGCYMLNFFKSQPALNYGWLHPNEEWQMGIDDPACVATRDAMVEVMTFWLSHGADGFRVDMADSLVKGDDEKKSGTCAVWRDIFSKVRPKFPDAAFVSEWDNPELSLNGAGFDMDFYLNNRGNGYTTLARDFVNYDANYKRGVTRPEDHSYFKKDAGGDITKFLKDYLKRYEATKDHGFISIPTGNHDTPRMAGSLTDREALLAEAFILTLPGVPFLYYGDEIGMRYQKGLVSKEGGYQRTGTRTPMQWDATKNHGFSTGAEDTMYLPTDPSADAPTVEEEEKDPASHLNTIRNILILRENTEELQADGSFEVVSRGNEVPFLYRREDMLLGVNPTGETREVEIDRDRSVVLKIGEVTPGTKSITMGPQSFCILL
jgi:maltose alpha-D-glucosyltransferase/alpha-amylase